MIIVQNVNGNHTGSVVYLSSRRERSGAAPDQHRATLTKEKESMSKYVVTRVTQDGSVNVAYKSRKCDAIRALNNLVKEFCNQNRYAIFYITQIMEDGSYYTIAKETTP